MDFYETSGTSCPFSGQVFCLSRGYTFCLCKQLLSGCGSVCRLSANVASTVSCSLPTSQGSRYSATLPARRKRPIDTHRCDSSVLCCLNSITQQMMDDHCQLPSVNVHNFIDQLQGQSNPLRVALLLVSPQMNINLFDKHLQDLSTKMKEDIEDFIFLSAFSDEKNIKIFLHRRTS